MKIFGIDSWIVVLVGFGLLAFVLWDVIKRLRTASLKAQLVTILVFVGVFAPVASVYFKNPAVAGQVDRSAWVASVACGAILLGLAVVQRIGEGISWIRRRKPVASAPSTTPALEETTAPDAQAQAPALATATVAPDAQVETHQPTTQQPVAQPVAQQPPAQRPTVQQGQGRSGQHRRN